jgi:hypothetical protein
MIKAILTGGIFLGVGVFLQFVLIETSPRIDCAEKFNQLLIMLQTIAIEFVLLLIGLFSINKLILKLKRNQNVIYLLVFTGFYTLIFLFFYSNYANKCCPSPCEWQNKSPVSQGFCYPFCSVFLLPAPLIQKSFPQLAFYL